MTAPAFALAGLDHARARARMYRAVKGAGLGLGLAATLAVAGFHLDRAFAFGFAGRLLWLALMAGAVVGLIVLAVVAPVVRRVPDRILAVWAERRFPSLAERLLSAVELSSAPPEGVSASLREALIRSASEAASELDLPAAVPRDHLRAPVAFGGLALLILAAHVALMPQAFRAWASRILMPGADIPVWAATHIRIEPGNAVAARGDSVHLRVVVTGRLPVSARVAVRAKDRRWTERTLTAHSDRDGARFFSMELPAVQDDLDYYARAYDGRSNTYRIRVEDRPIVVGATVRLTYPAYTGKPPTSTEGSGADILAPVGTVADIRLRANKDLAAAEATLPDGSVVGWTTQGPFATGRIRLMREGVLKVALRDTRGFVSRPDAAYTLRTIPDRPPAVRITSPARDLERSPLGRVHIEGRAEDDYGVGSIAMVTRAPNHSTSVPLELAPSAGAPSVRSAAILNLGPLRLKDGDVVTYHLEARDKDTVSGPHVGKSSEYRVRIVSLTEMQERADADARREIENLRRLAAEEQAIESALRSASAPAAARAAAERQRSVARQTAELRSQAAAATESMRENGLLGGSEERSRAELAAALDQLARTAMPRAAEAMDAAARQTSDLRPSVENAASQARDIRRELERLANASGPPESADQLAQAAARLAREQAAMADVSEARADWRESTGGTPPDLRQLAERQAQLQEQTRALAARLDAAVRSEADGASLRPAQRDFAGANVPERQAEAGRQLSAGRPEAAAELQRESAAALRRLASALLSGGQASSDPGAYENRAAALRKASDQLSDLANRQRQVQQAAGRNLSKDESERAASDERAIQSALGGVMPALQAAPAAEDTARRAGASMARAAAEFSAHNPAQARQPAQQATRELLQAAIEANDAARLLEEQADALRTQREIEALARDQRALRNRTQTAEKQAGKNDKTIRDRAEALAREQEQLIARTNKSMEEVDSNTLKWVAGQATRRMDAARSGLWQRDMGTSTRRYQTQAAQTLERLAASLEQQRLAAAMQIEAGTRGSPQSSIAEQSGEIRAIREMQAQIRTETAQIEDRRAQRPGRALSEEERRNLSWLGDAENDAQNRLREAANRAREAVGDAEELRGISQQMALVREALHRLDSGRANLDRQSSIIAGLDKALDRNRDELASARTRPSPGGTGQQQRQTARNTPGTGNAPVVQSAPPSLRAADPSGLRFGGLSPRERMLLQSGQLDKVPPEYRDLVSRYYRALSERR